MPFEIVIQFTGLVAFLETPEHAQTDVVFINPMSTSHSEHAGAAEVHYCDILVKQPLGLYEPKRLQKHDIVLTDTVQVVGAQRGGVHKFDQLPRLEKLFGTSPLKKGLRIGTGRINEVCSARLRIADGFVEARDPTTDYWQLEDDKGNMLGSSKMKLAREYRYVRQISGTTAKFSFTGSDSTQPWEFNESHGTVVIEIRNEPKNHQQLIPNVRNVSLHFDAVYLLLENPTQVKRYKLIQSNKQAGKLAFGLHVPCVGGGGCTTC